MRQRQGFCHNARTKSTAISYASGVRQQRQQLEPSSCLDGASREMVLPSCICLPNADWGNKAASDGFQTTGQLFFLHVGAFVLGC
jgi:hypothetical protein